MQTVQTLPFRAPEAHMLPVDWVNLSFQSLDAPLRVTRKVAETCARITRRYSEGAGRAAIAAIANAGSSAGEESRHAFQRALYDALVIQSARPRDLTNAQSAAMQIGRITKANDPIVTLLIWEMLKYFHSDSNRSSIQIVESTFWALNSVDAGAPFKGKAQSKQMNLECTRPNGSEPTKKSLRAAFKELILRRADLHEPFELTVGSFVDRVEGEGGIFFDAVDLSTALPYRSAATIDIALKSAQAYLNRGDTPFDGYGPWLERQLDSPLPAPQRLEDIRQLFIEPVHEIDEKFLETLGRIFEVQFGELRTVESMIVRDRAEDQQAFECAALEWMERRDPTLLPDLSLVFRALSSPEEKTRLIELLPKFLQDQLSFDSYLINALLAAEQSQESHESLFGAIARRLETTESSDTRAMLSQSLIPMAFYASPEIRIKAIGLLGRYGEEPADRIIKLLTLLALEADDAAGLQGAAEASVSAAAEKRLSEMQSSGGNPKRR